MYTRKILELTGAGKGFLNIALVNTGTRTRTWEVGPPETIELWKAKDTVICVKEQLKEWGKKIFTRYTFDRVNI